MSASSHHLVLAKKLLEQRRAKGLSARQLADLAEVHHSTVTLIERGQIAQPRADKLTRLARALELEPADFLTLAGYKPTEELPTFGVYLRSTTQLPDHAIDELRGHYEYLASRYEVDVDGPSGGADESSNPMKAPGANRSQEVPPQPSGVGAAGGYGRLRDPAAVMSGEVGMDREAGGG